MSETFNRVCARLLAGFLAAFVWQAPQTVQAEDLGEVMPMGDSITLGSNIAGGYRDPLYTLLTNRADTFTFVGSQTGSATAALTAAGQAHHEGHSGYVITNGTGRTGLDENLAAWIGPSAADPDKILLMIGSNDINLGYDMPNAPARLNDLITHIYDYRPSVKLYVASIIPMVGHEPDVQAFNATIPGIAASHRALGHDVVYVPMYEALNISTDLADGLHPNALGYLHMAQAWDTALHLSTNLTVAVASPANNQSFSVGTTLSATVTVANATGAYAVHVYTNSGAGAFAEAGAGGSSSPYPVSLGTLPAGTYHVYATATDTLTTANSATNTFTVTAALQPGQQTLSLTGWNHDLIIGKTEAAPGYSASVGGSWDFYEYGLSGGTQGLAADSVGTNRTFTSSKNPSVQFQFAPYTANNAVYLDGPGSVTLTLVSPAKFQSLQFLLTARTMSWAARLNFSDGSSTTTSTWSDPDWVTNPGPADRCLTSYGLKGTTGSFYTGYLWMAERGFTLPVADQFKTLNSITFITTSASGHQLMLFAVSGYVIDSLSGVNHAVDVLSAGGGASGGSSYSVGWDFTVTQPITVTSLGQFDPDSNPKDNTVALYQRAGAKLIEATVSAASPTEPSGNYLARYAAVDSLVLTQGNYVVFSTQNGDNFIAPGGSPIATFGPGVTWNKCLALGSGSAAGPLPDTAPATWPLEGTSAFRYFGPTFTYELVVPPPTLTLTCPTNNQELAVSESMFATATVANAIGAYAVHVYMSSGSGTFAEAGTGGTASPYAVSLGALPVGTYHIYATVTDTLASVTTATNTFTVAVKTGQQTVSLTGWTQDLIIGKTETAPGYSTSFVGWNFYETGLAGSTQGLPADAGGTNRTFTSSLNPNIRFQFGPYAVSNAVYLDGPGSVTLSLVNPARFLSLQFLETTRSMTWYATLNFADGTSTTTSTWSDPDWTANPGPADRCLTSYGLRKASDGSFYSSYLWMAGRVFTLPEADQAKTLTSITFTTTGGTGKQLAVFAVSGYALAAAQDVFRAVDVLSPGDGPGGGTLFSVGWDFTISQTITVTALGQFDPDSNPKTNTVAIYQRAGAQLVSATVSAASPSEPSGNYSARYAAIGKLVLPPGNYVVFSTQNGDNFIAGGGSPAAAFGPAVTWNKGVALGSGSAAGPLPDTAPTAWPIENSSACRYFGPTFTYELGAVWPQGLMILLR